MRWWAVGWLLLVAGCDSQGGVRRLTAEEALDPEACKDCHPDHYREWSGSMHAYAAEDPVFLAMNARGQRETDGALGTFCVGCHAPLAVQLGLTDDGTDLERVPSRLRGVTCAFCHQVTDVEGTHNNPLRVVLDGVMRGAFADPSGEAGHDSEYSPLHDRRTLESSSLCGSCHDIVTPAGLHLERTFAEWKESLFSSDDPGQRASCGQCHMRGRDGLVADVEGVGLRRVHDHSMPGIDVALTDFPERDAQRAGVERDLAGLMVSELCVTPREGGVVAELALENIGAGHAAPSGAAQDRRMWVELVAWVGGERAYESGVVGDGEPVVGLEDPDLWLLRDRLLGAEGQEVHMFWEAVAIESDLLPPPRTLPGQPGYVDPHVTRAYRFATPAEPERITVRVRVRPMGLDVLGDLVDSGDLDPEYLDRIPTFDLLGANLEWTREKAELRPARLSGQEALCVP